MGSKEVKRKPSEWFLPSRPVEGIRKSSGKWPKLASLMWVYNKKPECSLLAYKVPLKKVGNLALTVKAPMAPPSGSTSSSRGRRKVLKSGKFKGERTFRSWGSIRVFQATTRASESPSNRGISDLANQIRHSQDYQKALKKAGREAGTFLSPCVGEWFSGLPANWTVPVPGSVCRRTFKAMFPDAMSTEGKVPCIACFAGCGALELAMSRPGPRTRLTKQFMIYESQKVLLLTLYFPP